ncbi:hypothetical protein [Variovorax ginsengisoli]|jgi:hypothetical protein|uniref:Uncharacterized protein n=1 Tax=Variovorax ginsengisoli TaxID=363844 RepID=A0ABT8S8T7_9BURK|nr:hypothetical protein [Variovorax ginsengisoli]MDN8614671.1 hypothetical protein [Variovorax ginsengisoli]MDO1533841.1 hypothetical protein [Variovorax ginsengisoli]
MKSITRLGPICLALGIMLPVTVAAQSAQPERDAAGAESRSVAFVAQPVDADTLAHTRGGAEVVNNDMTLRGVTANNSARNVTTGDNTISAGSFANMSGLPTVIQNSGANVLIQNATILNLQMN